MNIRYFCPHWGNELPFETFCKNVKQAGYDGVEMDFPLQKKKRNELVKILKENGLLLIGQYWQSLESNFKENIENYKKHIENLAEVKPVLINTQTGKDYFTLQQNMKIVVAAQKLTKSTGIQVVHETHRGKFLFCLPVFLQALKEDPDMKIALDASHWCNVHESLLEDQEAGIKKATQATAHIHSRVGFQEGPQVNDPRAPEWAAIVERHFSWWDQVVAHHRKAKKDLTVTAEFGPAPYMPLTPHTQKPLANQWEVNLHMVHLFKERYKSL